MGIAQQEQIDLLEENTELFDLFGEEGFCTVCQMTLAQGERCRAIQKCQHIYHADCLEPWLRNHSTCPVCRVEVFPVNEEDTAYNNTLLNLWVLVQTQILRIQTEYHRRLLTWVLYDGILHQLPNAGIFNENIEAVRQYLVENRPLIYDIEPFRLIAVNNRTQLTRDLRRITREIAQMDNMNSVRIIRGHRDVQRFRNYIQEFANTREDFRRIWS